jgi:hypothetical protein
MLGLHLDVGALLPSSWGFGPSSPKAIGAPPETVQRQVASGEEVEENQRQGDLYVVSPEVAARIEKERGAGKPLESGVRSQMEASFGHDFSQVRVHTDSEADKLSKELEAKAFTRGKDIFFRGEAYELKSDSGTRLIAHELTHVVQQEGEERYSRKLSHASDTSEEESEAAERVAVRGAPITVHASSSETPLIQRAEKEGGKGKEIAKEAVEGLDVAKVNIWLETAHEELEVLGLIGAGVELFTEAMEVAAFVGGVHIAAIFVAEVMALEDLGEACTFGDRMHYYQAYVLAMADMADGKNPYDRPLSATATIAPYINAEKLGRNKAVKVIKDKGRQRGKAFLYKIYTLYPNKPQARVNVLWEELVSKMKGRDKALAPGWVPKY